MPSRVEQLRVQSRSASPPNRTRSTNWERTAVGHDEVHLILKPGEELPTVPYKLRFAVRISVVIKKITSNPSLSSPLTNGIGGFI